MKQFIAFVRKEFHHILRDRRTMLILIGMPIVQIILFGFAISTGHPTKSNGCSGATSYNLPYFFPPTCIACVSIRKRYRF